MSPNSSTAQLVGLSLSMSAATTPGTMPGSGASAESAPLTSSQKKRIKQYLKRCRMNPRHSQLNLEGYLLLPVQRIPRYRLLVRVVFECVRVTFTEFLLAPFSSRSLSEYVHLSMHIWKILLTKRLPKYLLWLRI
jgi:hypothetical protein